MKPFSVCLDDLNVFNNFENTKQFLCLSSRDNVSILSLKEILRDTIDQFAVTLTDEDETDDTKAHCSFMLRDSIADSGQQVAVSAVDDMNNLFEAKLGELPIFQTRINSVQVRIGNHIYTINLNG